MPEKTPSQMALKSLIPSPTTAPAESAAPTASQNPPAENPPVKHFLERTAADDASPAWKPRPDLSLNFRHSGWKPFREKVEAALEKTPGLSPRRVAAFRCCGADAYVEVQYTGVTHRTASYRVRSTKCHDRFCVPCSNERSLRIRTALLTHMHERKNMSLITLTLQQSEAPLSETLDRITRHFRALRSTAFWKKSVHGGAAIIEVKVGADGRRWHVHYHVLAETSFMSQKTLSENWMKITADSYIVDIRRVGAKGGAVNYITKYVTKAADPSIVKSPRHLSEAIIGFTGRRLVSTFGTWRGLQLMETPNEDDNQSTTATSWAPVGPLDAIILAAFKGDPAALAVMRAIAPRRFEQSG